MLKIGMYVDVMVGGAAPGAGGVTIPRQSVQTIGSKQVVFVATGQPSVFVQREVTVGPEFGGRVPVYKGISVGERVVTDGSFLLRAESLKQKPDQQDTSRAR
jgi:multidrug efflux pump subunit AcrA (membrane-fusion protein)